MSGYGSILCSRPSKICDSLWALGIINGNAGSFHQQSRRSSGPEPGLTLGDLGLLWVDWVSRNRPLDPGARGSQNRPPEIRNFGAPEAPEA